MISHHFNGVCLGRAVFYMLPRGPHSFIPERFGVYTPRIPARSWCWGFVRFAQNNSLIVHRMPLGYDITIKRTNSGQQVFGFLPRRPGNPHSESPKGKSRK